MGKILYAALAVVIIMAGIGAYFYGALPARYVSHWDERGVANGFSSPDAGFFLLPILTLIIIIISRVLIWTDPYRENYKHFMKEYELFFLALSVFMAYVYILMIAWNIYAKFNLFTAMLPGLSFLFFAAGILLGKVKRNWYCGIRTPWTLDSEKVWDETHRLGSKMFKASAIALLLGVFLGEYAIAILIAAIAAAAIVPAVYSYILYRRARIKARR